MAFLKDKMELRSFRKKFRQMNCHNEMWAMNIFPEKQVSVGRGSYGAIDAKFYSNPSEFLKIGNYCSVATDVMFICGGEHRFDTCMSYPIKSKILGELESYPKGPIVLEDDVWVGARATILSGVTIKQGAIIAAGAVIRKDVPAYAITDGSRVIRYRFNQEIIDILLKLDYSKLLPEMIKAEHSIFEMKISSKEDAIRLLKVAQRQGWSRG